MTSTDIFRLDGKRVLVTGATGGLGCHFSEVLARAGATVIVAGRRVELLELPERKAREAGAETYRVTLDVSNPDSVRAAFDSMPLPDVVINNAGIKTQATTLELAESDWTRVMDTNVKGAWLVAREAIRRWIDAERAGNVVNVASVLGFRVQSQLAVYAASKAALLQLTRSLALDYARYGVRSNALCPGYFATDMNREWLSSESGERMLKRIPYRRTGLLHELDGALRPGLARRPVDRLQPRCRPADRARGPALLGGAR